MISIGVFGSSLPQEGDPAYEEAREVGREIARQGAVILCGGYGGVMEAVCRGASEGGGESVGLVLAGRGSPNRWVSRALSVGDLSDRLRRLRDESEAAIFLPHGLGTMLEIVWMAESVAKWDVRPRPLVFLGEYWRAKAEACLEEARGPGAALLGSAISFAATPAEAVGRALGRA